ncbi:laccase-1-like [Magnolia sinica]|uniref:laccase-1-like n=1 Tax=Magnolia sinica TaxID=86752 RepID=UPI00265A5A7F|nr:laccase-1-like [Magnolia sinica]
MLSTPCIQGRSCDSCVIHRADTFIQTVEYGKTYMLRIINAALNAELFFAIANHTLTVVEIDGAYVKQLATPAVMIAPGQTTTVLLTANIVSGAGDFTIAARPYVTAIVPIDNTTTIGFLHYGKTLKMATPNDPQNISLDFLPPMRDTAFNTDFSNKLQSLASSSFPCNVPQTVDKHLFLSVSLNLQNCPPNKICKGFFGKRLSASLNNQSFIRPPVSMLESCYGNLTNGGLLSDFPENPTHPFNYTAPTPLDANMNSEFGTRMILVPYSTNLEFVLQDTSFINVENHPIHIHGHNFFIVGSGFRNFNSEQDPAGYNLVDPPERNTVAVPSGGWAAIRFQATYPGVWFLHCHLEVHTTWGLATVYIVSNGPEPSQSILPPPKDLPQC